MSWKIMDIKIWFNCTSYAHGCVKKKKNWRKWNGNENEKTLKRLKMKRKDK